MFRSKDTYIKMTTYVLKKNQQISNLRVSKMKKMRPPSNNFQQKVWCLKPAILNWEKLSPGSNVCQRYIKVSIARSWPKKNSKDVRSELYREYVHLWYWCIDHWDGRIKENIFLCRLNWVLLSNLLYFNSNKINVLMKIKILR